MSRKVFLMILVLCISMIFTGCKKKAPEGISQEFYDDMIFALEDLMNELNAITKEDDTLKAIAEIKGYDVLHNYTYTNKFDTLTLKEQSILDDMRKLYTCVAMYYQDSVIEREDIEEYINSLTNALEIEIDIDKIIF